MRSARALSALLLLLLLLPPSLFGHATNQTSSQPASSSPSHPVTVSPDPTKTSNPATKPTTLTPASPITSGSNAPPVKASGLNVSDNPTGALSDSQGGSASPPTPTISASPETTSRQGTEERTTVSTDHHSNHAPTHPMTTQRTDPSDPHSPGSLSTEPTPVVSHASPTSPHHSTVTAKTPDSPLEGSHNRTTVPSGSSPAFGTGSPTAKGTPTTPTSSVSTVAPQGTPQGTGQTSSQMPASLIPSFSTTPQPGDSSTSPVLGTVVTPAVGVDTHSSTHLASTAPQGLSTPSSTLAPGKPKVDCVPPVKRDQKLLILNLTETNPCAKSPPADDKLVTQLCRAAKATFNPAQDSCTVQMAPIQESQAVAIQKITIQTNLLPENVYELLKDKWDDLREVGVSHMQLGNEGPPEEAEDRFSMPLIITIVCMASFLLLVAALYGCCHQRLSQRKDQQRLTEELQTVENGYHDNPTLEVMETSSEMQEKKVVNLNGELGDSWIVPLDNLTKDDLDEEEDTHL